MKQHITPEQLNELSEKGRKKLWAWCKEKGYLGIIDHSRPLEYYMKPFSIGQMVEFLVDQFEGVKIEWTDSNACIVKVPGVIGVGGNREGLCDALWEAVKEVLEK